MVREQSQKPSTGTALHVERPVVVERVVVVVGGIVATVIDIEHSAATKFCALHEAIWVALLSGPKGLLSSK